MKLEELLDHVAKEYLDDRTELIEGDNDDLFSDTLICRHLNEAQRILCRRAWCLIDIGHPQAGVIVLKTGVSVYPLHKSVLRVLDATPSDQEYELLRYPDAALRQPRPYTDDFVITSPGTTANPGRPLAIATDTGTRLMRVYPTPSATENGLKLNLRVTRHAVCLLDAGKTEESPEVPEDWHMSMAMYAAGKCLTQPNVSSAGRAIGVGLVADFDKAVSEARRDRQRAGMNPDRWAFSSTTARL